MGKQENLPQVYEDISIDLFLILKRIYQNRKLIIVSWILSSVLGVVVALATPDTYTVGSTFIPQTSGDSNSSISGLASLAGISVGSTSRGSNIPPALYSQIIASVPYKLELLNKSVVVGNSEVTIFDYLNGGSEASLLTSIKKYTIGLPGVIIGLITNSVEAEEIARNSSIYQISKEVRSVFSTLSNQLFLVYNKKEGFVTLEFTDNNKFVAAQVAEHAKNLLQERIITFQNQSARELLDFTLRQYNENKSSYEALQDSIAIFKDQNLNISSSLFNNRLDRLERELNIASSVLEQLASQVEQAKLQVNKDTPVFTIIEPVTVPFEKSAPMRSRIVVIWTFLGILLSTGFVLVKDPAKEIIASIRE